MYVEYKLLSFFLLNVRGNFLFMYKMLLFVINELKRNLILGKVKIIQFNINKYNNNK